MEGTLYPGEGEVEHEVGIHIETFSRACHLFSADLYDWNNPFLYQCMQTCV